MGNTPTSASAQMAFPAIVTQQQDIKVYSFVLTADNLLTHAKVDRFGESADGVNRKYDEKHALDIAAAMIQPGTLMQDAICGDLKGDWGVENGKLIARNGAYLSIDDGQHRYEACGVLNAQERERWSFVVVATMGLDYKTRLQVFRQQALRKPIDKRLDLAQRHTLDAWKSDAEREAYRIILQLNSETDSPLKGMIVLEETPKRPYEHQHRVSGINSNGLWASFKSVMSKGSPLFALSMEKRRDVILNMIAASSETWANAWQSNKHVLTTSRGLNAVIKLIVSGPNFRLVIGEDFTIENLRRALGLASKYNWLAKNHTNMSQAEITAALDNMIGRAYQRQLESGGTNIKA